MIYPTNVEILDRIKSRPHYEVSFDTEAEAREEEYLLNDGWSPYIDMEVDGTTLYFSNVPCFGDHAKIVAANWWNGRAKACKPLVKQEIWQMNKPLDPEKHTISELLNFLQEAGKVASADHPAELNAIDTELDGYATSFVAELVGKAVTLSEKLSK